MELDLDELIAELESGDEEICWDAACEIMQHGPSAAAAVPSLTWVLKGSGCSTISDYVVGMAADALGQIGPEAANAIESLVELTMNSPGLPEERRWLRLRAAAAHWRITGDERIARQVATELTNDPEQWLREHAEMLLASLRVVA